VCEKSDATAPKAIVTVLSLVNPLICGAMFAQIEAGQASAARLADATKAALAVLVILVIAALVGAKVLHIFGVSLDAFSVAGGVVLAWIGFSMMRGHSASVPDAAGGDQKRSLTPLILFAASPGTITGVITIAVVHTKLLLPVTALVAVGVATLVMWIVMVLVSRQEGTHGEGGFFLRDTATRFMGLIVIAMGTQFALTGLRDFFNVQI
jgi:multiple antibiotic resistance protein